MAGPKKQRLVAEKRGFRVKPATPIKLGAFIKEFLQAKEEGKGGKKRRKAKPRYLGTLRYRLDLLRGYLPEYSLEDIEPEHLTDFLESRHISGRTWNNYRRDFHVA